MICVDIPPPQYLIFTDQVPGLLYYSHIPVICVSFLIGFFVFVKNPKSLPNALLFLISIFFSIWTFLDLIVWTNVDSDTIVFTWSFFGTLNALICLLSVYFIYVFADKHDVSFWHKLVFFLLLAPVILFAPTAFNLSGFNLPLCGASGFEGQAYLSYYTGLGLLSMVWIGIILLRRMLAATRDRRRELLWMGVGIEFFLLSFFTTGFLASYLNDIGYLTDYSLEFYGLFGMAFFMAVLGFLIVRFKTFNTGMLAAQALILGLIAVLASEFAFVTSLTNQILVAVTLVLTGLLGIMLIRSVKREIAQREHIEKLARDLQKANDNQVTLIHFITHQIKGFVTKSRNIFSMILEGDFGPVPEQLKPMIQEGFNSDTKGAATIQEILNASNIKSGKVTYKMQPFDLKALIDGIAKDLKPAADAKGIALTINTEAITYTGDSAQLTNAFKNLIDNSIKYTPKGTVGIELKKVGDIVKFSIHDTGVGITPEDMKNLFTEGGHGKESTKVNVESTGFGLYIVKNIIEAHKGKVWAESEGAGKGSCFFVELPA